MKRCPRCNTPLPEEARFCWQCGAVQPVVSDAASEPMRVELGGNLEQQLFELFFAALKGRIEREHHPDQLSLYSERLYASGFRDTVGRRTEQLAELIREMAANGEATPREVNFLIDDLFEDLLDFFIIRFCKDLNEEEYPEAILKYQYASLDTVNLLQLVLDYLQFDRESEEVYTDFLAMPVEKLKNVSKNFLFPAKDEKILLISDHSLLGSGKEGFALTDRALYWKAPLQKARFVAYPQIRDYRRTEDWITINGFFFNVTPAINLRMLRLLSRLQRLFR